MVGTFRSKSVAHTCHAAVSSSVIRSIQYPVPLAVTYGKLSCVNGTMTSMTALQQPMHACIGDIFITVCAICC